MVSGSRLLPGEKAIAYVKTLGGTPEASVIGSRIVTTRRATPRSPTGCWATPTRPTTRTRRRSCHPGCAHRAGGAGDGRARAARRHRAPAGGRAGLRHRHPDQHGAARLRVPRRRPLDPQLRSDVRRGRRGRRAGRASMPTGARWLLSYAAQQCSGRLVLDARRRAHREIVRLRRHARAQRRRRRGDGRARAAPASRMSSRASATSSWPTTRRSASARRPSRSGSLDGLGSDLRNHEHQHQALVGRLADTGAARLPARSHPRATASRRTTWRSSSCASRKQGANTTDNRNMPDICMQHMCAVMLLDGIVTFESAHDEKRMRDREGAGGEEPHRASRRRGAHAGAALAPGHRRAAPQERPRAAASHEGGARHGRRTP